MKTYPNYKDSGVPWLRDVPEHWESHRAKFLFKKMSRPVRGDDDVVTCFRDGTVTLRKNRRTKGFTESLKEIGYQGIRKGDLVIHQMDAFAGAAGVSDSDGKGTPIYSVCHPKRELEPEYFAHLVREMARNEYILSLAKGIRERSTDFRFDTFGAQLLPFPPLSEQQQIARYLDWQTAKINQFIKAKKKLIALLKEQKQNIINEAVTKGINPDAPMKDSGVEWLGEIPAHWEVRRIKSLSQVKRGASPRPITDEKYFNEQGEYAWVRIADVTVNGKYLESTTQVLSKLGQSKSITIEPKSIFLSIAGSVGKPIITKIKCCIHDGFVYFPNYKGNIEYLYYVFVSGNIWSGLGKLGTQLNLNTATVGAVSIGLPLINEQQEIVAHIEKETALIDKTITRTEREIELIAEYRTRLISDVVTGKVDIRSVEIPDFEPVETELEAG